MEIQNAKSRYSPHALKERLIKLHPKLLFWGAFAVITLEMAVGIVRIVCSYSPLYSAPLSSYVSAHLCSGTLAYAVLLLLCGLCRWTGKPHHVLFWTAFGAVTLQFGYKLINCVPVYYREAAAAQLRYVLLPRLGPRLLPEALAYVALLLLLILQKRAGKPNRVLFWGGFAAVTLRLGAVVAGEIPLYGKIIMSDIIRQTVLPRLVPVLLWGAVAYAGLTLIHTLGRGERLL